MDILSICYIHRLCVCILYTFDIKCISYGLYILHRFYRLYILNYIDYIDLIYYICYIYVTCMLYV